MYPAKQEWLVESTQKQLNCKKVWPMQKRNMKKVVKSKVAAQKWLWWSDNGIFFNNNNSGKFVLPPPTGNWHQNCYYYKFCHNQTTTATSGPPLLISQLFSCCLFLHGQHLFLQFSCFCVDFPSFCNLTCTFAFTGYS